MKRNTVLSVQGFDAVIEFYDDLQIRFVYKTRADALTPAMFEHVAKVQFNWIENGAVPTGSICITRG